MRVFLLVGSLSLILTDGSGACPTCPVTNECDFRGDANTEDTKRSGLT